MYENRNTTEFPTQSLIRTFVTEVTPNVPGTGLRPTWFADAEVVHNAALVLECVLERPLEASAGLAGDTEAAGASVHLRLQDGWRRDAHNELVERFQQVLYRHIVGEAVLPATRTGLFVAEVVQRLIRRAASEAVARMLDELDDSRKERLAQVNWRMLAPALEEHATFGYVRATKCFEKSVLPLCRPPSFKQAVRELQTALRSTLLPGACVVVRMQILSGETAFELASASAQTLLAPA